MSIREYDFVAGVETSAIPDPSLAVADEDIANYGQIQDEFTSRQTFENKVADLTALKAVPSAQRYNNQLISVEISGEVQQFFFDSASAEAGDDVLIVVPTVGTGRWKRVTHIGPIFQNEGVNIGNAKKINFTGTSVDATLSGETINVGVTAVVTVKEEGSTVNTNFNTLNFVGTSVTATDAGGGQATITISGGSGGLAAVTPEVKSANYTLVSGDDGKTINVDTSSIPITITLPTATVGYKITIKDYTGNASVNNIIVDPPGLGVNLDNVDGFDVISINYASVSYVSDGTSWFRIAGYANGSTLVGNARGVFGGNQNQAGAVSNTIDYIAIATPSNATDFGDLSVSRSTTAACASSTRGLFCGGYNGVTQSNVIDYITIATTGNAIDFGDLTVARDISAGCSSSTRGLTGGGFDGGNSNVIDYVTIASIGNATDFGDLTVARRQISCCGSTTRGVWGGGFSGANENTMDYVTIATTGNATDFGDLTLARRGPAACSSNTRGLFGAGKVTNVDNTIDYITIATTGNATDFGDLTVARTVPGATASTVRGVWAGGADNSNVDLNTIDYVTIASTGNATDFGDLTIARQYVGGLSNAHGGL